MQKIKFYLLLLLMTKGVCGFSNTDTLSNILENAPKVYVDCNYYCDLDYIKQNITWVNYVRDRKLSDVQVVMRVQATASGGDEYQIQFIGFNDFKDLNFTLNYVTDPTQTKDEIRKGYLKIIQTGLMPFMSKSEKLLSLIDINYSKSEESKNGEQEVVDKWKNWVFDTNINGWGRAESSTSNYSIWGGIGINRIVNQWKYVFNVDYNYNENRFLFGTNTVISTRESKSADAKVVYSLSPKWSAGLRVDVQNSTYNNYDINIETYPAIEYNLFPYSESSKHIIRLYYGVLPVYNKYTDTTIFNKKEEFLTQQKAGISARIIKKWGSLNTSITASNYFHDINLNRLSIYTNLRWRIFKGFSFNVTGNVSFIRDQINLPKEGVSYEEVLLSQKVLATNYSYWVNFGFSYTFGSIYNSIVNPRFGLD